MPEASIHYEKDNYKEYLYSGLIGFLFRYQHRKLSPNFLINEKKILEIGPGYEPHIKYKKLNFEEYHCAEISTSLELNEYYQKNFPNVIFNNYDGKKLNYPDNTFDRIIISHTLEHILKPESFMNEMLRVLKKGGYISIALPCDNGLLWRFGRFLLKQTYHKIRKFSEIDFDYFIANEHVNTIFQLLSIFKKKFKINHEVYLPFRIKFPDINLIYICHIKKAE
jgi:phosphatidylethanolamine/phosphatidyl-N-methylethanolamine N-methyltransferase